MSKPRTEKQIRADIATIIVYGYIPKLKEEVARFNKDAVKNLAAAETMSAICDTPITIELGRLKIAEPTNELIDKLVDYVRIQENT